MLLISKARHSIRSLADFVDRAGRRLERSPSTRWVAGQKLKVFHRNDYSDRYVIFEVFDERQYEVTSRVYGPAVDRYYEDVIASGKTPLIVDCGANIGATTLWFAARFPGSRIIAVEPAQDNFVLLQKNCTSDSVDLFNVAVDSGDGWTTMIDIGHGGFAYRTGDNGSYRVRTAAISSLLAHYSEDFVPFYLKIDIEGAEKSVFESDSEPIARFPVIAVEVHDRFYPGDKVSTSFFEFHSRCGRDIVFHDGDSLFSIDYHRLGNHPRLETARPREPVSVAQPS
jgi:FkbM family methyltransferase